MQGGILQSMKHQWHSRQRGWCAGCDRGVLTGAWIVGFVEIQHGGEVAALESLLVLRARPRREPILTGFARSWGYHQ